MDDVSRELGLQLGMLKARTERLHRLTARLSAALREDEIAALVVEESAHSLGAYSAALWRPSTSRERLVLLRAHNYPDRMLALVRSLPLQPGIPVADAVLTGDPVWLSSRAEYEARYPVSAARTADAGPDLYAVAALPLHLGAQPLGVMALTFLGERVFDEDERRFLTMLALHCAQGFERVRLHEAETHARQAAEAASERAVFLSKASALLGSSLDYEQTLQNVAALAVPRIGDWCGVELVDEVRGGTTQVAVAHIDPSKVELAHDLRQRYPPDPSAPTGVPNILRTGRSELYPEVSDEMLVASARDAEHLAILRELGLSSAMAVPIKDRGSIVGAITFVASGPSRRYTEDDLRMAEQLAERAGSAIGNARLYARANAAIALRDDFLSIAGHELRTPIASLSLHLQTQLNLPDGTPPERVRERAKKMLQQTERIARLVNDLLDVSHVTAGRLVLDRDDVELGGVVHEVVERLAGDSERAGCSVEVTIEEVHGRWDRDRIDQIAMNLLTNAIKYGRGQPIEVQVRAEDGNAILVVTDHGIGIAPEDHARIFQRFERAVSGRNYGGLGLGLWIVRQLVDAHGGSIHVDSAPGAGATFTTVLPCRPPRRW